MQAGSPPKHRLRQKLLLRPTASSRDAMALRTQTCRYALYALTLHDMSLTGLSDKPYQKLQTVPLYRSAYYYYYYYCCCYYYYYYTTTTSKLPVQCMCMRGMADQRSHDTCRKSQVTCPSVLPLLQCFFQTQLLTHCCDPALRRL